MSAKPPGRGAFLYYVERIRARLPFAFSRWGDGEWSAILGLPGQNCDRHRYTGKLRRDLTAVLEAAPPYDLGLQGLAMRRFGTEIAGWLARRKLVFEWVDADIFARRSAAGQLSPLLTALATREVILVGPAYLAPLRHRFHLTHHVIVPEMNCHDAVERLIARSAAALHARQHAVLAVSASMSANVLIHRLYSGGFAGHTLIDFGSLWEPYVGRVTRRYHRRVLAREAQRR